MNDASDPTRTPAYPPSLTTMPIDVPVVHEKTAGVGDYVGLGLVLGMIILGIVAVRRFERHA